MQHHQNNISKYFTNANEEPIANKPSSKHKISASNVNADHEPQMKRNRVVDKNNDFNLNIFSNKEATKARMKKDKNLVTDYFDNNLSDEDFVSPEKRMKLPKLPIKKAVPKRKSRKKQPDIRKLLQNNEEKIFDDLISQHSQNDEVCPEQMQLALALSKSLVDQEQPFQSEINLPCTSSNDVQSKEKRFELMKSTLEQYGFKCKTSYYGKDAPELPRSYLFPKFFSQITIFSKLLVIRSQQIERRKEQEKLLFWKELTMSSSNYTMKE